MILVVDNYDSFTYNLVQYVGELGAEVKVYRNDKIKIDDIKALSPDAIIISPGPGRPDDACVSKDVIREFAGKVPILGVCLGHQCIAEVFGASVVRSDRIMHGKVSNIYHDGNSIFAGLSCPFVATRYHSLVVAPDTLKEPMELTAWTDANEVMGLRHREMPVYGVQFHPESILTVEGKKLIENFIQEKSCLLDT
ncbi:MAG: aminodeoxychorismate/anthranilate synthase component II [Candidatus Omnitrophica bacterium]|nr:aminodeoxychorismate/anthranilate synthase component II [Candidatus Omnitrophota bacterium]MBU1128645.1 aminodeoxychorismate/anthranilate synthase component II [Candidatus Omnitrophota bacterium]MBU1657036.1 aminodeoxychorismate/anthranilate synthase component II [Candidatus Omnitrophota bacterium]MBU1785026.1 aminodeoxychorismate/anthranilate synthase component II [Candidatus Omnitrophota bacterium]MBU1852225.1 aminodeoxychorismate/anthranilate synthase component II [Candidatus Omnitrophota